MDKIYATKIIENIERQTKSLKVEIAKREPSLNSLVDHTTIIGDLNTQVKIEIWKGEIKCQTK